MRILLPFVMAAMLVLNGCSQLKTISDTLTGLKRLEFKLKNVAFFKLANISLSDKSSISDFSPLSDGLNLLNAYRSRSLVASFMVNVDVHNPNDGTAGSKNTNATLKGLDFRLLIDGKPTINGDIGKPVEVPATGQSTTVPVLIYMDLMQYFQDKSYEDLLDLALAIGGKSGSAGRLTLDCKPTVDTPLGAITYPGRIQVIDKEFRN